MAQHLSEPQEKPEFVQFKHWDQALKQFLIDMGLTQTLKGFENDMLVLNPDWEAKTVPGAMANFVRGLVRTSRGGDRMEEGREKMDVDSEIEERKLSYVHTRDGIKPQSQTSINKTISQFIARNRARNDASNRAEFLRSLDEIRASAANATPGLDTSSWASCARTDMKTIDRDLQMKYDIARNEDGPLKRTMKGLDAKAPAQNQREGKGKSFRVPASGSIEQDVAMSLTPERYPGLDERIRNIEAHVAVRYVPGPPKFFLDRLKFLEDHLIRLEKDYPPWAALHFNQPHRGWPPPPRSTPIIVPPHMRRSATSGEGSTNAAQAAGVALSDLSASVMPASGVRSDTGDGRRSEGVPTPAGSSRAKQSTLHKAVLEKLEVVQAMNDLAGREWRDGEIT